MPSDAADLLLDLLENLEPDDVDPRKQAEEALLTFLRAMGDTDLVQAYEAARERCGW